MQTFTYIHNISPYLTVLLSVVRSTIGSCTVWRESVGQPISLPHTSAENMRYIYMSVLAIYSTTYSVDLFFQLSKKCVESEIPLSSMHIYVLRTTVCSYTLCRSCGGE